MTYLPEWPISETDIIDVLLWSKQYAAKTGRSKSPSSLHPKIGAVLPNRISKVTSKVPNLLALWSTLLQSVPKNIYYWGQKL